MAGRHHVESDQVIHVCSLRVGSTGAPLATNGFMNGNPPSGAIILDGRAYVHDPNFNGTVTLNCGIHPGGNQIYESADVNLQLTGLQILVPGLLEVPAGDPEFVVFQSGGSGGDAWEADVWFTYYIPAQSFV